MGLTFFSHLWLTVSTPWLQSCSLLHSSRPSLGLSSTSNTHVASHPVDTFPGSVAVQTQLVCTCFSPVFSATTHPAVHVRNLRASLSSPPSKEPPNPAQPLQPWCQCLSAVPHLSPGLWGKPELSLGVSGLSSTKSRFRWVRGRGWRNRKKN